MTDKTTKSPSKGTAATLLVGVAVGAAGMYLRDKDNQKKVAKKLDEIRAWSDKNMKDWKEKAEDTEEKVVKMKDDLEDQAEDLSDEEDQPTKSLN